MSRYIVRKYYPIENHSTHYEALPRMNIKRILYNQKELTTHLSKRTYVLSIVDKKRSRAYYYNLSFEEITEREYVQLIKLIQVKHNLGV